MHGTAAIRRYSLYMRIYGCDTPMNTCISYIFVFRPKVQELPAPPAGADLELDQPRPSSDESHVRRPDNLRRAHLEAMYMNMATEARLELRSTLLALSSACNGLLTVGSLLSGTNVQALCWDDLADFAEERFAVSLRVDHTFANENVAFKQGFIGDFGSPPKAIFPDVHAMAKSPESVQDASGRTWNVPRVNVLVYSIECDDLSGLSKVWRSKEACCIEEGTGRSGGTAASVLTVIKAIRPAILIGECVTNLGQARPSSATRF